MIILNHLPNKHLSNRLYNRHTIVIFADSVFCFAIHTIPDSRYFSKWALAPCVEFVEYYLKINEPRIFSDYRISKPLLAIIPKCLR